MSIQSIDGHVLKVMMIEGMKCLESNKDLVDSLNVFPVPDGDTGTNMMLTTMAAVKELDKLNTGNIAEVAKAVSGGSLRGARGNSGVILSQIFRGFARGLDGKSQMSTVDLGQALNKAQETAYRAIMKPKEGTILTVTKYIAEQAVEFAYDNDDLGEMFAFIIKSGNEILERTTQMLPQLRQAGVVDSGGKGLLCILEGMYKGLKSMYGEVGPPVSLDALKQAQIYTDPAQSLPPTAVMADVHIEFIYCTEFFIDLSKSNIGDDEAEDRLKGLFEKIGDSIVVVCDERIVKVHVHTNHPGSILELAIELGELSELKIENMRLQHTNLQSNFGALRTGQPPAVNAGEEIDEELGGGFYVESGDEAAEEIVGEAVNDVHGEVDVEVGGASGASGASIDKIVGIDEINDFDEDVQLKQIGFVAVAPGEGFSELLRELGADEVIEGGQTMNPSTDDILRAAEKVIAENIVILPNNKNIILAAKLAEEMSKDKKLHMVPTKTVPQGIAALISYVQSGSFEESIAGMQAAISEVKTGSITRAVRSTVIDDREITEGDIICIVEDKIEHVSDNFRDAALDLIKLMIGENSTVVTIYFGADVEEAEALDLKAAVSDIYTNIDIEIHYGAQPVYNYIISVE